jgi:hypothetical protein
MLRELCDDFQKVDNYCKENDVTISDAQIDTFMAVLDDDANGMLEYEEVVDVLEGNFIQFYTNLYFIGKKNIGLGKEEKFKKDMLDSFEKYFKKFQKFIGFA